MVTGEKKFTGGKIFSAMHARYEVRQRHGQLKSRLEF